MISGDGDLDGGRLRSGRGGDGVLGTAGAPGNVRTMGGGEVGDSMLGMNSAKRFLARANGNDGRPNAESSDGIVGRT